MTITNVTPREQALAQKVREIADLIDDLLRVHPNILRGVVREGALTAKGVSCVLVNYEVAIERWLQDVRRLLDQ